MFRILLPVNDWNENNQRIGKGIKVAEDFTYSSDNNSDWMHVEHLQNWVEENRGKIGNI